MVRLDLPSIVFVNKSAASETAPLVRLLASPPAKPENALPAAPNKLSKPFAAGFKALMAARPDVGKFPSLGALAIVV